MDTSETYIKMCEKAEEIQLANLDFKTSRNLHQSSVVNGICIVMGDFFYLPEIYIQWFDKDAIWLPRQDQLQEILRKNAIFSNRVLIAVIDKFRDFVFAGNHLKFETMEQLWLAFAMKEKYGKTWEKEKWAKITK